jgi:hypothetical protein
MMPPIPMMSSHQFDHQQPHLHDPLGQQQSATLPPVNGKLPGQKRKQVKNACGMFVGICLKWRDRNQTPPPAQRTFRSLIPLLTFFFFFSLFDSQLPKGLQKVR